jgi:hypothetical protein
MKFEKLLGKRHLTAVKGKGKVVPVLLRQEGVWGVDV